MKKLLIAAAILPFLTGCFLIENNTAILWTDIPEVAAYVELFNASQTDYRVELVYAENPADYYALASDSAPDIVISEDLASNSIIKAFNPLDKMIEDGLFDPSVFYPDLYSLGCREEIPYVLPVSFNIPAIMYKQDNLSEPFADIIISPEKLKTEAEIFNSRSSDKFRVKGFAPSWIPDFLLYNAFISGSDFTETADGSLIWNETNLQTSIDFCRDWTENINGGFQEEDDFTLTYCYDPGYKLLNAERIGFYYTTLRDFSVIPAEDRANLDFKWLGDENKIPVCDDIVYAGIPSKSNKKKTAKQFLMWFMNSETQQNLLESSQFKRSRVFGICGGLSSLQNVNELVMPEYHKILIGTVPPAGYLSFPASLPSYWKSARADVVIPWLQDQNMLEPEMESLTEMLKIWTLQEQKK
ncbi:MAG: ABC transporter substrate-binding protein [Spirochaetales bacterium]|uniref:ABC transporter substrate-binding protein n=1 Tax=Candidatus Thalassospirochaeta sargassi TaxID=3119039 RepID=A0AAJ1IHJ6_9SPIO|nr:ABC transporter substrate-binding protein [Spirochaetales bacterium]